MEKYAQELRKQKSAQLAKNPGPASKGSNNKPIHLIMSKAAFILTKYRHYSPNSVELLNFEELWPSLRVQTQS